MSLCDAFSSFEHHLRLFLLVTPLGLITGKDLFQNLKDVILSFHPLTLLSIRTLASVFAQARLLRQPVLHRLVRLLPLHLGLQALLHRRLPQRPRLVRDGRVRLCHGHVSSATGRKWKTPNGTVCTHAHTYEHTHTVQRSMVERARASVQAAWHRACPGFDPWHPVQPGLDGLCQLAWEGRGLSLDRLVIAGGKVSVSQPLLGLCHLGTFHRTTHCYMQGSFYGGFDVQKRRR